MRVISESVYRCVVCHGDGGGGRKINIVNVQSMSITYIKTE